MNGVPKTHEIIVDDALPAEIVVAQNAHQRQEIFDFTQEQNGTVVEANQAGALLIECFLWCYAAIKCLLENYQMLIVHRCIPVDWRKVDDNVDHVATELVALHIHRRTVGGDVNLRHNIE